MDGVHPLCGVWNGGGVYRCCPAQCGGVARALLIPVQCWRVLLSCRAPLLAGCCGVSVSVWCVLFVWWGILCALPPRRGGGWGHCGWWVAWWVKGGCVAGLPFCCVVSPFCCVVVLLNGGRGGCACCPLVLCCPCSFHGVPCLRIRYGTQHCPVPLCIVFPCVVLPAFSLCCRVAVLCAKKRRVMCVVCVVSL